MTLWTIVTLYLVGSLLLVALFMSAKRGRTPSQQHFEDDEQARFLTRASGSGHRTSSLTSTSSGTAH